MSQFIDFLKAHRADIEESDGGQFIKSITTDKLAPISAHEVQTKNTITGLIQYGIIEVTGEDAHTFLNNQISNELNPSLDSQHIEALYCNPKGEVIANFTVLQHKDAYWLICYKNLIENLIKRLKVFIFRSRVTIQSLDDYALIGLSLNDDIHPFYSSLFKNLDLLAMTKNSIVKTNTLILLRYASVSPTYLIICKKSDLYSLNFNTLFSEICFVTTEQWNLLTILSGKAQITITTSEQHIAQTLNFDVTDNINFQKGCFPGQEVIARLHYRGKPTKRLSIIEYKLKSKITIVKELKLKYNIDRETVATVINNSVFVADDCYQYFSLAIVSLKPLVSAKGDFDMMCVNEIKVESGCKVSVIPLPYSMD